MPQYTVQLKVTFSPTHNTWDAPKRVQHALNSYPHGIIRNAGAQWWGPIGCGLVVRADVDARDAAAALHIVQREVVKALEDMGARVDNDSVEFHGKRIDR